MEKPHIPDRLFFKISEVADITGVKPYVLRYWESEFDLISPVKSKANQRVYERKDIEVVLLIKKLLYVDQYTIAGAKKKLKEARSEMKEEQKYEERQKKMEELKHKVKELHSIVTKDVPPPVR